MDKEEPNFNIWGEISDSNMVLEVAKVEQKYEKQLHLARVILRETSHETKINACGSWFHLSLEHSMTSFLWSIRV